MKGWRTTLVAGLALAVLTVHSRAAAPVVIDKTKRHDSEADKLFVLPDALSKAAPQSPGDLKAIQDHVKLVIKKVTPAVVAIQIGPNAGSGVIVDEDGTVLTAGHVSGKPGQRCLLILPDGKKLEGKSFGYNRDMDSGMIKITKKGKYPFARMGDSDKLKVSEWVLAIGHPGGYKETRSTVVRLGRVNKINTATVADFGGIYTDCTLVGGDSGGPLFDMQGRVIGIHSQIRPKITENVHVPVNTYRDTHARLAKGEVWGSPLGGLFFGPTPQAAKGAYLGVVFDKETKDLRIDEVTEDAPAEKAGLKSGDVILAVDDQKLMARPDLMDLLAKKKPNDTITMIVRRDGAEMTFRVRLGQRPG